MKYRIDILAITPNEVEVRLFEYSPDWNHKKVSEFICKNGPNSFSVKPLEGDETFNFVEESEWDKIKPVIQAYMACLDGQQKTIHWV